MIKRFLFLFGTQILFGATLLVNNLIVARFLGPVGKGKLALLIAVPMLLSVLVSLGFHLGVTYGLSRREVGRGAAVGTTLFVAFIVSVITLSCSAVFFEPVRREIFAGLPAIQTVISFASLPFLLTLLYFEGVWVALDRMGASSAVRLTQSSVYLATGIVLLGPFHAGVTGGIMAFTGAASAATLVLLLCLRRLSLEHWSVSLTFLQAGMRFGLANHAASVADYVLCRADVFIVAYLVGSSGLGYYSFASPIAELIWWLSAAVKPVLFSRTAQLTSAEANETTPVVLRITLLLAASMAIAIFGCSVIVVHAWLATFEPALPVLAVLLVATTVGVVFQLLLADLSSRGHGALTSRIALAVLPFGLAAYAALISTSGIMGAALASLVAYATKSVVALFAYKRLTGIGPASLLLPRASDVEIVRDVAARLWSRLRVA